ncbi:hypothetical protein ONZ45_g6031 [Pleurotus djamor]|nr:hypothetical protein ONZ45_g6031 [Pleurotus djamor]
MPPFGSEEDQRIIIEQCEVDHAKNRSSGGMITCTLDSGKYKVKYGVTKSLTTRIHTQPWLYSKAESEADICVPELLGQFEDGKGRSYLVMKYIELVENPPPDMASKIVVALRWLASLTNKQTLGPLGGDHIVHSFFNEREAPCAFKSLDALDRYIAKASFLFVALSYF